MTTDKGVLARVEFYPWAFALGPIASLLAENMDALPPGSGLRASLALIVATLIAMLVGARAFQSRRKAAVFWTIVVTTSFLVGNLAVSYAAAVLPPQLPAVYRTALLLWILLVSAAAVLVAKAQAFSPRSTLVLNIAGFVALAIPLFHLAILEVQMARRWSSIQAVVPSEGLAAALDPLPDIYYIILDGYGRQDVLSDLYGLDNQDFIDSLESRGFAVLPDSYANYAQTSLSLASALNLAYLDHLAREAATDRSQWTVAGLIRHSALVEILKRHGYSSIAFAVGYRRAELSTADRFILLAHPHVTPLEALLLEQSGLAGIMYLPELFGADPWLPGYLDRRESIQSVLEQSAQLASQPGPKFVLIHVLAPHPPFVFDEHGQPVAQQYPYRFGDGTEFLGTREEYVEGYARQLRTVNAATLALVDAIRLESATPPIIILQGDHGPGSNLDWDDASKTNMWERLAILNAIAIPGSNEAVMYSGLSPVNTFRVVLNHLLGASFELLPNRSYFSSWKKPYGFQEVNFLPDGTWSTEGPQ